MKWLWAHILSRHFPLGPLLPYFTKRRIIPGPISNSYYKEHLECYFKLLENYPLEKSVSLALIYSNLKYTGCQGELCISVLTDKIYYMSSKHLLKCLSWKANRTAAARTFTVLDAENSRRLWLCWKMKDSQLPRRGHLPTSSSISPRAVGELLTRCSFINSRQWATVATYAHASQKINTLTLKLQRTQNLDKCQERRKWGHWAPEKRIHRKTSSSLSSKLHTLTLHSDITHAPWLGCCGEQHREYSSICIIYCWRLVVNSIYALFLSLSLGEYGSCQN